MSAPMLPVTDDDRADHVRFRDRRRPPSLGPERIGLWLGVAAAVAWLLLGLESTVRGGERHVRDVLWFVPWVLTMATLVVVDRAQRTALSRRERVAGRVLAVSMVAVLVGNVGVITGVDVLAVLGFPLGALVWVAAMVAYGVVTIRAGVLPRRTGWLLILLEPLSIVTGVVLSPIAGLHERGNFSGAIEKGVVLWLIASVLAERAHARGGRPRPSWLIDPLRRR